MNSVHSCCLSVMTNDRSALLDDIEASPQTDSPSFHDTDSSFSDVSTSGGSQKFVLEGDGDIGDDAGFFSSQPIHSLARRFQAVDVNSDPPARRRQHSFEDYCIQTSDQSDDEDASQSDHLLAQRTHLVPVNFDPPARPRQQSLEDHHEHSDRNDDGCDPNETKSADGSCNRSDNNLMTTQRRRSRDTALRALSTSKRRSAMTSFSIRELDTHKEFLDLETATKAKDWLCSFRDLDPRYQILRYFNDLSLEGVDNFESLGLGYCRSSLLIPKILRGFIRNGIFSVFRPTSSDAIRKMITGEGTGKGLDIKGKSAKRGIHSGFVPFLQIHDHEHKQKIGFMTADKRVRVFYPNKSSRDMAEEVLSEQGHAMNEAAKVAKQVVDSEDYRQEPMLASVLQPPERKALRSLFVCTGDVDKAIVITKRCLMDDPAVRKIDDYASNRGVYGLDIPEKLFWEAYVVPNDITCPKGSEYDTGRPSMPEFQQMNIETLRKWSDGSDSSMGDNFFNPEADPRPVLWHAGCGKLGEDAPEDCNPLCPLGLLMAYEENSKVIPVVSDFDCFLLGTRGVRYQAPLSLLERSSLSSCVDKIERILEKMPKEGSCWVTSWLEVIKQDLKRRRRQDSTSKKNMPKFGYADPRSYSMMTGAVNHLKSNGAVRHGPECFNYDFPQELDDQYLVISDTFPGVPWRYTNPTQLIDILCEKIDQGFTFPLNPKWILCDSGWKKVYDKLLASSKANVQDALNIWYPEQVRRRIHEISTKYPQGFISSNDDSTFTDLSSGVRFDLAQLELQRYMARISSRRKLREALVRRSEGAERVLYRQKGFKSLDSGETSPHLSSQDGVEFDTDMHSKTWSKLITLTTEQVIYENKEEEMCVTEGEHIREKKRRSSSIMADLLRASANNGGSRDLSKLFEEDDEEEMVEGSKGGEMLDSPQV